MEPLNNYQYSKFQQGQKACLNCGTTFTARRSTRKYCSDNCKQLHFYKRNGVQLSGTPDYHHNVKNQAFNVKPEQLEFNVKDNVKTELHSRLKDFTVNDKIIDLLLERIQERIDIYMEQAIDRVHEKIRTDKIKQDFTLNDKTPFNVNQQHQPLAFNDKTIGEPEDLSKEENNDREEDENVTYQLQYIKFSNDEPILNLIEQEAGQSEEENDEEQMLEEGEQGQSQKTQNPAPEKPYEYISSLFLDKIKLHEESLETLFMFSRPQKYWNAETLAHIRWVSQHFSTLIGTLLHLDAQHFVDKEAVYSIAEAFHQVYSSKHFSCLPTNYPFVKLIKELAEKMIGIVQEHQNSEAIRFRLSPDRKAQLIYMRWQMGDFVPRIKFSQTNFKEQINNNK